MSFPTQAGGSLYDSGFGIVSLNDGSFISTGYYAGSATFGSQTLTNAAIGNGGVFVAKLLADGSYRWAIQPSGIGESQGFGITSLSDGSSIVTGRFSGTQTFGSTTLTTSGISDLELFVAKVDPLGYWSWASQTIGSGKPQPVIGVDNNTWANSVTSLSDGSSIITGQFEGTTSFGSITLTTPAGITGYIAKLNADGSYAWATKTSGAGGGSYFTDVTSLSDGSSIVSGWFQATCSFGSTTFRASGETDAIFAKLNADGSFAWATRAENLYGYLTYANGISSLSDGSSVVTGQYNGTVKFGSTELTSVGTDSQGDKTKDIFVAKLDASGNYLWATSAGGNYDDTGNGISTLNDGSSIITGEFTGSATFGTTTLASAGDSDIYVAKIDTNGNYLWATRAGGTGLDEGLGITTNSDGSSIITGEFGGNATFGSITLESAGQADIFVAKLDANGNWLSASAKPTPIATPAPIATPTPIATPESFQTDDGFAQFTDAGDVLTNQSDIKYRLMGGNDYVEVIGGSNYANGNTGEDTFILLGGKGEYLGGKDRDTFEVFAAEDGTSVNGNRGEDTITGSVSGVTYRGGKDNDTLAVSQGEAWGDLGVDVFRGVTGEGYAVIQDYTIGEDIVELTMDGNWSNIDSGLMFTDTSGDQLMLLLGINDVEQVTRV